MWHVTANEADHCYQDGTDLCTVSNRVNVGLQLGLGARESFIADGRQGNPWDRLPVAGRRYRMIR